MGKGAKEAMVTPSLPEKKKVCRQHLSAIRKLFLFYFALKEVSIFIVHDLY